MKCKSVLTVLHSVLETAISLWLLEPIIKIVGILPSSWCCHFCIFLRITSVSLAVKNVGAKTEATIGLIITSAHQRQRLLRKKGNYVSGFKWDRCTGVSCWHLQRAVCSYSSARCCTKAAGLRHGYLQDRVLFWKSVRTVAWEVV